MLAMLDKKNKPQPVREFIDLHKNLNRIKELTNNIKHVVSSDVTIIEKEFSNLNKSIIPIHTEIGAQILIANIDEEYIHETELHNEYETLILLEGRGIIYFENSNNVHELQQHIPMVIDPNTKHITYYPKKSRVLIIFSPARKNSI